MVGFPEIFHMLLGNRSQRAPSFLQIPELLEGAVKWIPCFDQFLDLFNYFIFFIEVNVFVIILELIVNPI